MNDWLLDLCYSNNLLSIGITNYRQAMIHHFLRLISSSSNAARIISSIKERVGDSKGLPSDGGWAYLINDTNDFLAWQFGINRWSAAECSSVSKMMAERLAHLSDIPYFMLVTPEKSVAYREWLPEGLSRLPDFPDRPVTYLAAKFPEIIYPIDYLGRMKRHGFLYYRSDTHVNWLGSFLLYRYLIDAINARGIDVGEGISLKSMLPALASWEGDVMSQSPETSPDDPSLWQPMYLNEALVQYNLPDENRKARRLADPDVFRVGRPERETIITVNDDSKLPRALIFRDSTATLMVDLLAEHFSRAVFIWHRHDVIGDLIESERPDVVLHFKAERFLSEYPETRAISWAPTI
ncbi:hypothetical protein P0D88_01815 [Paraburkholderia sp. RL18-103-BIB-C]|uniref:hypothetical protein n=1 Tax=Paraburkholderia sp. RL18-103-BIB-C TaxID=3031637 RepID=UPI0038BC10E3